MQRRPEAACDWRGIAAANNVAVARSVWHDPPTFPLPVRALGLLPCLAAPATFLAVSLAWHCGRLIRRIVEDRRFRILAAARAAGRINLFHGKNGLRTAALAGFALQLLERRPAGDRVLIGLLAIKPHPAILFPIARAASGR